MKKGAIVPIVTVLVFLLGGGTAWAPFKGLLTRNVEYTFRITDQSNDGGTAVAFLKINRRDKIATAEPGTIGPLELVDFPQTCGTHIDRLTVLLSPTEGGGAEVKILENGVARPPDTYTGDAVISYDCVP